MGRETGIAKIEWGDDDWPYLPDRGLVPAVEVPGPDLPAHPFESEPDNHDFTNLDQLPHCFMWPRTPDRDRIFRLTEEGLELTGRESIGSWFEQALVARRQTEWNCEAETELVFAPEGSQQMAGLVAYYNRTQFFYLAVTRAPDTGQRSLNILSCSDWPEGRLTYPLDAMVAVQEDTPLRLGLTLTEGWLQFRFASGEDEFQAIGPSLDAHILSDEGVRGEHSNFTGTFIGMAAQDVSGRAKTAIFRNFKMKYN
jgi:xylan 1,4-beta-xylosidase